MIPSSSSLTSHRTTTTNPLLLLKYMLLLSLSILNRTTRSAFLLTTNASAATAASTVSTTTRMMSEDSDNNNGTNQVYYRKDGVRITHDPYAKGMAEKYGLPGQTDSEGFDPYADTVGPGIYSGSVERSPETGEVLWGQQYQNHNNRPGPPYDGTGYSLMSKAIQMGPSKVSEILKDFPDLANEISAGGARPLHTCGMSQRNQYSTQVLVDAGANIYQQDTYGYTPLHRMASNNLAMGGEVLVKAGHDPNAVIAGADDTPIEIAKRSRANKFLLKMKQLGYY